MSYSIRVAKPEDIPAMVAVVNAAFGVERHIVEGDRTSPLDLMEHMDEGQFLLAVDEVGRVAGSVYVEARGERSYMGMLAVDPAQQGAGVARRLMSAVEDHARGTGAKWVDMYVLSARTELLALYRKFGYSQSGARTPHPEWAPRLNVPCYLIQLSKTI